MTNVLTPESISELPDAVRSAPRVVATGALTKPRLTEDEQPFVRVSTRRLNGIIEYQPEEYTVTALAGTPMKELTVVLEEHDQYLPFDPMFLESGCTLGGTIGAGTSGPGRFRFGGVRDFVLAVRFVDGDGRLLRMGAKVVKNAAGFDLPKFFVGSLGRFGLLADATLKVFPRPESSLTVSWRMETHAAAVEILTGAGRGRWELEALDLLPGRSNVLGRLAGPASALEALAKDLLVRWPGEVLPGEQADRLWANLREAHWAYAGGVLLKCPITPLQVGFILELGHRVGGRVHISAGGNVAWISVPGADALPVLDEQLRAQNLTAMSLRGKAPLWLGARRDFSIAKAVKQALDPAHRFPS
jgi:glycolate oxidase FAD binding subunit